MIHSKKCEYAKKDICRCSCGGELHGIRNKEEEEKKEVEKEIGVNIDVIETLLPEALEEKKEKKVLNLMKWLEEGQL